MNLLKNILLLSACCLVVSGCASPGEDEGPQEPTYASGETNVDMTYPEMAREMSNGSVQVYGLDGAPAPMGAPPSRGPDMAPVMAGVPSAIDPNVTIFPFDDETTRYAEGAPQPPSISPPSSQYRPLHSPFGGPIQTPAEEGAGALPAPVPFEPAPPPAPASVYPAREASLIYFKHGSARLNEAGKQVIEHVAQTSPSEVVVDGHASRRAEVSDPVEREIVNLEMSMKRAVKVSSDLIRKGIPVERIETRAFGAARPAEPVPGVDQEAANRRVEIHTEGGDVYDVPAYSMSGGGGVAAPADLTEPAPIPPLARY